jgi:hypothetical protein
VNSSLISPAYLPLHVNPCHTSFLPPPGMITAVKSTNASPISSVFLSSLKTESLML